MFVILNEVKNLIKSSSYKTEILRLTPQNDIVTRSPRGEGSPAPRRVQDKALNLTWFRGLEGHRVLNRKEMDYEFGSIEGEGDSPHFGTGA